ncbi:hypothetical protein LDENG_00032490 [Lucifuga dentata]|nr:hypothetical protein LDENG_00032490 [Lucifuga dentata]
MDEAEKYQQRLQAIAEKRRLQEDQDRARREMEDEKLRLQQLKRKSLRDQWLMDAAPVSPTSPDAQSPRSPLWGSPAQEIEKRIDKLQSENQRLSEEEEKLKEQMEDGQTEAEKVAEAAAEVDQVAVVQNGENKSTGSGTVEDAVSLTPRLDETAAVLTNGGGDVEVDTNHGATEESTLPTTNGLTATSEDAVTMMFLGFSEAEPDQLPNVNILEAKEEEEEGTLVMRAERVIITDEGDDAPEDISPQEDQQDVAQSEATPLPNPEAGKEGEEIVEEVENPEAETLTEAETSEMVSPTAEAQTATPDGVVEGEVIPNQNGDGETKAEGEDDKPEAHTSVQLQSPDNPLEGTTVASVPVYSEAQPSSLTPRGENEGEDTAEPEGAEVALTPQNPAIVPGQFQEVSLADPQENQRTKPSPEEQEPLLSQVKPPQTQAEPAAACSPASTETNAPNRVNQGGEPEAPKRKTCQCCSVM